MALAMHFLGTGTSQGVPVIDCNCTVCKSHDPRDKRLRSSVLFHVDNQSILVDAGPDLRAQLLRTTLQMPTSVVITHAHQDHTAGMDDLRPLIHKNHMPFPVYAEENVQRRLREQYAYAFSENKYPGAPSFEMKTIDETPFFIRKTEVTPIRAWHGDLPVLGFRIGDVAYLTDVHTLPESEKHKLKNLKVLVLNALRHEPHHSHLTLSEAIDLANNIGAEKTYFTHISHHLGLHANIELPDDMALAYDGLTVNSVHNT
jgi:phosphoribosyl 1,2-cyclic phosphate phosphodiesterase